VRWVRPGTKSEWRFGRTPGIGNLTRTINEGKDRGEGQTEQGKQWESLWITVWPKGKFSCFIHSFQKNSLIIYWNKSPTAIFVHIYITPAAEKPSNPYKTPWFTDRFYISWFWKIWLQWTPFQTNCFFFHAVPLTTAQQLFAFILAYMGETICFSFIRITR
jgi:hypothetical protein